MPEVKPSPPPPPPDPPDEGDLGLAGLGAFFYGLATGLGVGIFFEQPYAGAVAGGLLGIVIGRWIVPALVRDGRD